MPAFHIRQIERCSRETLEASHRVSACVNLLEHACYTALQAGHSIQEIARVSGWSPTLVRRAISNARERAIAK